MGNTFGKTGASDKKEYKKQSSNPANMPLAACSNEVQVDHDPLAHFTDIVGVPGIFPESKGVKAKLITLLFRPGTCMFSFIKLILLCIGNGFEHQQCQMDDIQHNFRTFERSINLTIKVQRKGKKENQYKLIRTDKKEVKDFKEQSVVYLIPKVFPAIVLSNKPLAPGKGIAASESKIDRKPDAPKDHQKASNIISQIMNIIGKPYQHIQRRQE